MPEIKTQYNLLTPDLAELNRVLSQIADRLDSLEGLRGTPTFHADLDMQQNKIVNVSNGEDSGEVLTYPAAITDFSESNHDHEDTAGGGKLDHGDALEGLADDDHTQYLLLAGRAGGQEINDTLTIGNTTTGNYLTIANGTVTIYSDNQIVHKIEGGS